MLLAISFEWVTCVVKSKKAHVHVFVRACECLHGLIFTLFRFSHLSSRGLTITEEQLPLSQGENTETVLL